MSVIVTARIDKEMHKAVKRYRINVSKVMRAALRTEIKRREKAALKEKLSGARSILAKAKQ